MRHQPKEAVEFRQIVISGLTKSDDSKNTIPCFDYSQSYPKIINLKPAFFIIIFSGIPELCLSKRQILPNKLYN